jgi:hypothetical protein
MSVVVTAGIESDIEIVTSPANPDQTATLAALYGTDGISVASGSMVETSPGVYRAKVTLDYPGIYWAKMTVGLSSFTSVVRCLPQGAMSVAVSETVEIAVATEAPSPSLQILAYDADGNFVGVDEYGVDIEWPKPATQVPNRLGSWYYGPVRFLSSARLVIRGVPSSGPEGTDRMTVYSASESATGFVDGWVPDEPLIPSDWISTDRLRRMNGWASMDLRSLSDLRDMAVQSIIQYTGVHLGAVAGTFNGVRGQGNVMFLPMPVLLPHRGGISPLLQEVPRHDQRSVRTVTSGLAWMVSGQYESSPRVSVDGEFGYGWDEELDYRIHASWGLYPKGALPSTLWGVVAGVARWHQLAYGVGPDQAVDKGRLGRETDEATRDRRVGYHADAIGLGLTGFRDVDRELNRIRVDAPPWVHRSCR